MPALEALFVIMLFFSCSIFVDQNVSLFSLRHYVNMWYPWKQSTLSCQQKSLTNIAKLPSGLAKVKGVKEGYLYAGRDLNGHLERRRYYYYPPALALIPSPTMQWSPKHFAHVLSSVFSCKNKIAWTNDQRKYVKY